MKTLLILRHAKATKNEPVGDFDRALTARGEADARAAGCYLRQHALVPELIVTSPARRAKRTAELAADAAGYTRKLTEDRELYLAELDKLLRCIRELPDRYDRVMLVGHNNGLEDLVRTLTRQSTVMQTAGLAQVECQTDSWALVEFHGPCKLRRYFCPERTDR